MPPKQRRAARDGRIKHGTHALQTAVKAFGSEGWLDALGPDGELLRAWRDDLVADLGGEAAITTQERTIVDMAVRTLLILEHIDRYMLSKQVIVNKGKHTLFPVAVLRLKYSDSLARYMSQLGLERRMPDPHDLSAYVEERYGNGGQGDA